MLPPRRSQEGLRPERLKALQFTDGGIKSRLKCRSVDNRFVTFYLKIVDEAWQPKTGCDNAAFE